MTILRLHDVSLVRQQQRILDQVSLGIYPGEIHSVLGRNGTGKTSLAYAIMGLPAYQLSAGKIDWNGNDITACSIAERARLGITMAWQEPARFEGLSVQEYLRLSRRDNANALSPERCLEQVGLEPKRYLAREVDSTLSGGERKRIELAAVLAMQPRLAILDEPDSGIDVLSIDFIKGVIRSLVRQGTAILLITHHEEVAAMADRTSALCAGRILKTGTPEEVARFFRNHCHPCQHVNQPQNEEVMEYA